MFFSILFPANFLYQFKPIGLSVDISDEALTLSASIGAVVQAFVRLVAGWLYDIYGFKPIMYVVLLVNIVIAFTCYAARNYTPLYILCLILTYFVMAGVFGTFPTAVPKTFGPKYGP